MKIARNGKPPIIIGKRVSLGAVSALIVVALLPYFEEHAAIIRAIEGTVLFCLQVLIANKYGVTDNIDG